MSTSAAVGQCCCQGFIPAQRCAFAPAAPLRVVTFDLHEVIANPLPVSLNNLVLLHDGAAPGPGFAFLGGQTTDTGLVIDLVYAAPRDRMMQIRVFNNGGNILGDNDGVDDMQGQLFDEFGAPLTAVFTVIANNGGGPDITAIPGAPIDGVARLRLTDIHTNGPPASGVRTLVREIDMMQQGLVPAALVFCPNDPSPVSWVNPLTGAAIAFADLTDCR